MLIIGITFALAIIIIIGMDIYLVIKGGFPATLSYKMMMLSIQYPVIPFAFGLVVGILAGHFFWDQTLNVTVACPVSK